MTDDDIMEIWTRLCRDQKNLGKNIAVALALEIESATIERCAEVCNDRADLWPYEGEAWAEALGCAAAIRALKGER